MYKQCKLRIGNLWRSWTGSYVFWVFLGSWNPKYYSCCTNSCLGLFRDSKMLEKSEKSENRKKICLPLFFLSLPYKLLFLSSKTLINTLWHLKIQIYHQVAKILHRNHSFHRCQHGPHRAALVPKDSQHYGQVWPDPPSTWLSAMNSTRRTK